MTLPRQAAAAPGPSASTSGALRARLGHADVAFTLRRYTGYWTNMQAGAAEKIGSLLGEAVAPAV